MNSFLYAYVALVMQASQAHNVPIPGGRKYNVPSGNITIDDTVDTFYPNRTSYSQAAIAGSDDFSYGNTTTKDAFDIIVENTREVSPTCKSRTVRLYMFILLIHPQSSRSHLASGVRTKVVSEYYALTIALVGTARLDGLSVLLSGFPHTVLSGSSTRFLSLKIPCAYSTLQTHHSLTIKIPRPTLSRRSQAHKQPPTCLVTTLSCSSNWASVTPPSRQVSSCTSGIVGNYVANSTVGVILRSTPIEHLR